MPRQVGPLKTVWPAFLVQQVTRWIVKGHQNTLVDEHPQARRAPRANAVWGSDEHAPAATGAIDAARVEAGLKANRSVADVLLGGAFLSGIFSGLLNVIRTALENRVVVVVVAMVMVLLSARWPGWRCTPPASRGDGSACPPTNR